MMTLLHANKITSAALTLGLPFEATAFACARVGFDGTPQTFPSPRGVRAMTAPLPLPTLLGREDYDALERGQRFFPWAVLPAARALQLIRRFEPGISRDERGALAPHHVVAMAEAIASAFSHPHSPPNHAVPLTLTNLFVLNDGSVLPIGAAAKLLGTTLVTASAARNRLVAAGACTWDGVMRFSDLLWLYALPVDPVRVDLNDTDLASSEQAARVLWRYRQYVSPVSGKRSRPRQPTTYGIEQALGFDDWEGEERDTTTLFRPSRSQLSLITLI